MTKTSRAPHRPSLRERALPSSKFGCSRLEFSIFTTIFGPLVLTTALVFSVSACNESSSKESAPPVANEMKSEVLPPHLSTPSAADEEPKAPGFEWPVNQVFPNFISPSELDVIDRSTLNDDNATAVTTLQGLVNRIKPRVYILENTSPSKLWLKETGVPSTKIKSPLDLIAKYKSEVKGLIVYDNAMPDTINLGTTIAGLENAILVSPTLAETLKAAPYHMIVTEDLRDHHFKSALEIYQYQFDTYAPLATHRMIFGLTPTIKGNVRDYTVAVQGLMIWLNPGDAAEKALLDRYLSLMEINSPYLGWWKDEPLGVHQASLHGVPVYAADWSSNLTALGGKRESPLLAAIPAPPKLENKLYISIFISDGDNLQEDQGLIPLKWADSHRGEVPTAWTISPALVDIAPVILKYFQRTATPNDVLVSGPSGLGYTYPAAWPKGAFEEYTKATGDAMDRSGLKIITLWNDGADLSADLASSYLRNIPNLQGLTIQSESRENQLLNQAVPIHRLTISYGDTEAILAQGIEAKLSKYHADRPLFASLQGNMNMGTISPTAIAKLKARYANNNNIVFVRPDHFFQLMALANQSSVP